MNHSMDPVPIDPAAGSAEPGPGLLDAALRITGAGAASRRIAAALGSAQALAEAATGKVAASMSAAREAGVDNFAIELGQRLANSEPAPVWASLVAGDDGFELLARGDESAVPAAASTAVAQRRAVRVCKVIDAHHPA